MNINKYKLQDFFEIPPIERPGILLEEIKTSHSYHFSRNSAYRRAVEAKGAGDSISEDDLIRILRPTSQVFKSYIDILGTPFPNHQPEGFIRWLGDNFSIELPPERLSCFKEKYSNLEDFLSAIESTYSDLGFEIGTSSGTSGRATIIVHDKKSADKAVEAYQLAVYRMWGTIDQHHFIFVMPRDTRIVMARVARMATARLGLDNRAHFTIPFSATPDQVRIRTGRVFEEGMKGWFEMRVLHPFMNWMNENYVKSKYVNQTISLLEQMAKTKENILLFGGWIQLHHIFMGLLERGYHKDTKPLVLGPESMIGTGGGVKEAYPVSTGQIRQDLQSIIRIGEGKPITHRDVFGMAEANWAAAQCGHGNYHLPPWLYAVVIDDNDAIVESSDAAGLMAFFDPFAEGGLFPSFFKTADRVHLVNGGRSYQDKNTCPCGYQTAYLKRDSIIRQDRLDEAGCAGQL
ncbi:MAG: hypothetical protein MUO76_09645 [Anaerolineaceae bacterium]|nr:hypothetical protein [Anaerolineaceae bacterium]